MSQCSTLPNKKHIYDKRSMKEAFSKLQGYLESILWTIINISTAPFYNLYFATGHVESDADDHIGEFQRVARWHDGKKEEYKAVQIAGTIIASVVTGSLQWSSVEDGHWVVSGSWVGSLTLSLFCVVIAFHLSILMSTAEIHEDGKVKLMHALRGNRQTSPGKSGVFVLQTPILLLSYSIISYLVGLAVLVIGPLWNHASDRQIKIAATLAVYLSFGSMIFFGVCFYIYLTALPRLK